jgi:hypothetical protein
MVVTFDGSANLGEQLAQARAKQLAITNSSDRHVRSLVCCEFDLTNVQFLIGASGVNRLELEAREQESKCVYLLNVVRNGTKVLQLLFGIQDDGDLAEWELYRTENTRC